MPCNGTPLSSLSVEESLYPEDGGDMFLSNVGSNYSLTVQSPKDLHHQLTLKFASDIRYRYQKLKM
jgi:hypothetical protein